MRHEYISPEPVVLPNAVEFGFWLIRCCFGVVIGVCMVMIPGSSLFRYSTESFYVYLCAVLLVFPLWLGLGSIALLLFAYGMFEPDFS